MPKFLTREEIYKIIQQEQPDSVYPYGAPEQYYVTANNDAEAKTIEGVYNTLQRIYINYFPITAEENLPEWEEMVFGKKLDSSLSEEERRGRVLVKIRSRKATMTNIFRLQKIAKKKKKKN